MPNYNYICLDCQKVALKKHENNLNSQGGLSPQVLEEEVLYETSHPIEATDKQLREACECPRCGSHKAERTLHGSTIIGYVHGYGYLDKAGCKRDMNRYKLIEDDPYGQYRQPGEVEHIKGNLDKGAKHDPKSKHFVPNKTMESAVEKAVHTPTPKDE